MTGTGLHTLREKAVSMLQEFRRSTAAEILRNWLWLIPRRLRFRLIGVPGGVAAPGAFVHHPVHESESLSNPPLPDVDGETTDAPVLTAKFPVCRTVEAAGVFEIEGGISTFRGVNLTRSGFLVPEASFDRNWSPDEARSLEAAGLVIDYARMLPKIRRIEEDVLSLTCRYQQNYYHWLFEVLPRVHLAEAAGARFSKIYCHARFPYELETLETLGYPRSMVVPANEHFVVKASRLVVPSVQDAFARGIPSWKCRFLRSRLQTRVHSGGEPARDCPARLYLSRGDAAGRRLTNEHEIIELLSEHGFEVVTLSEFTVEEQARLFQSARTIVAPHGAGIANIVFCEPGASLVEISAPRYIFGIWHDLAARCGLNYHVVFGEGADLGQDHGWKYQWEDYTVSVDSLGRAIENAINESSSIKFSC